MSRSTTSNGHASDNPLNLLTRQGGGGEVVWILDDRVCFLEILSLRLQVLEQCRPVVVRQVRPVLLPLVPAVRVPFQRSVHLAGTDVGVAELDRVILPISIL